MKNYLEMIDRILTTGLRQSTRTSIDATSIFGTTLEHNLADGFPLLTTKFVSMRLIASELEFFIKGITDKRWLQERNNHIWDDWANKEVLYQKYSFKKDYLETELNLIHKEYLVNEEIIYTDRLQKIFNELEPFFVLENNVWKKNSLDIEKAIPLIFKFASYVERDLGPIYGFQWRHFGADYRTYKDNYTNKGFDQLQSLLRTLEKEPTSRRLLISAWEPSSIYKMALDPCHYSMQFDVRKGSLNLLWNQRSVDFMLGYPFNQASYALLVMLIANQMNFKPGKIVAMLGNTHIYDNQVTGAREQLQRTPKPLPTLILPKIDDITKWSSNQYQLKNYFYDKAIKMPLAV